MKILRAGSSVGEHTTEARGVGGSIPSPPIESHLPTLLELSALAAFDNSSVT